MLLRIVLFMVINFGALALGGLFTSSGIPSDWYANLNKPPWIPPGWVFGAAWTTVMICFSFYMALLYPTVDNKRLLIAVFALQFVLNVSWNPVFFYWHNTALGLIIILLLTLLVWLLFFKFYGKLQWYSLLILPYCIWILIASSLNGYIFLKN